MSTHGRTPGDPARFTPARADTLEALLALAREYYDFDGIPFDEAELRRGLAELLTDASLGGAWIIRRGDEAVGYFVLTYGFDLELGGRQATVTELYLRPHARRQGIGSCALAFVEDHLRQVGIGAYELHVERDNAEARAFYARMGLEPHDRIPLSKRLIAPPK
jgi:GNAT superfamily N-acetyltransferase